MSWPVAITKTSFGQITDGWSNIAIKQPSSIAARSCYLSNADNRYEPIQIHARDAQTAYQVIE